MKRLQLRRGERSFIKNVAIFMTGRSAATAVTFLLTPVISRLYLPEHFGVAAVFIGVLAVVGPLACGGYEKAIAVARSSDDARNLLVLSAVLAVTVAFVVALIIGGIELFNIQVDGLSTLGWLLWLLPVAVVLDGIIHATVAWGVRHQQYRDLAIAEVVQTSTRSGIRVIAGSLFGSSIGALIVSYAIGAIARIAFILKSIVHRAPIGPLGPLSSRVQSLPALAASYSDFPRYNMITGFAMQMTTQLPVFVLGAAFGAPVAGFFAMADRLMRAPIHITTNTLRQVVIQKFAEIWNQERSIRIPLIRTAIVLLGLGIAPFFAFVLFGEELFTAVLGERWRTAGRYISLLAPYFLVNFLGAPFHAAAVAMRKQRLWFWLELCTALGRLAIIPVAAVKGATPELVLHVYVWTTVATKCAAMSVVFFLVPGKHPGFASLTRN